MFRHTPREVRDMTKPSYFDYPVGESLDLQRTDVSLGQFAIRLRCRLDLRPACALGRHWRCGSILVLFNCGMFLFPASTFSRAYLAVQIPAALRLRVSRRIRR